MNTSRLAAEEDQTVERYTSVVKKNAVCPARVPVFPVCPARVSGKVLLVHVLVLTVHEHIVLGGVVESCMARCDL